MKLIYKSTSLPLLSQSPLILISDIDNGNRDTLTLSIFEDGVTFVFINEKKFRMKGGKVDIAPADIPDGISGVTFILGTKRLTASPFLKKDGFIERVPIDSAAASAIEDMLLSIHSQLAKTEERLLALEEKTTPKNMFKFNQTT